MSTVDLPNWREPPIDPRTGQWNRAWWLWLQQLMTRIGGSGGTDLSAIITLLNEARTNIQALERQSEGEWNSQAAVAELLTFCSELQASVETMAHAHGQWEDPDMHALATTSQAGFMSASDKSAVDASVPNTRQVIAGAGMTGGGDLSADRTLNVVADADGSISVSADSIKVGILATDAQHGNRGGGALHANATTGTAGFMSSADKTRLDGIATSCFRAYQSSSQSISLGVFTTVSLQTELFDDLGEFSTSTYEFVPSQTGTYAFMGAVRGTQSATLGNRAVALFVNGTEKVRMAHDNNINGNASLCGGSGAVRLTAGDVVTMRYFSDPADTTNAVESATYFSGWRIK